MTHVGQYERTTFTPSDIGYGPCIVKDAEGRIIRRISTDVIRARDAANEKAAEAAAKAELADHPTVPRRSSRGRAFVPKRHRKAAV